MILSTAAVVGCLGCGSELLIDYNERVGASFFFVFAVFCFVIARLT